MAMTNQQYIILGAKQVKALAALDIFDNDAGISIDQMSLMADEYAGHIMVSPVGKIYPIIHIDRQGEIVARKEAVLA